MLKNSIRAKNLHIELIIVDSNVKITSLNKNVKSKLQSKKFTQKRTVIKLIIEASHLFRYLSIYNYSKGNLKNAKFLHTIDSVILHDSRIREIKLNHSIIPLLKNRPY